MTALPIGLRWLVCYGLDNLDDRTEVFSDFEQGLDWTFRMVGYADKRHSAEGLDSGLVTNFPWIVARQVIRLRQHIC
jgi:hypothetical protein